MKENQQKMQNIEKVCEASSNLSSPVEDADGNLYLVTQNGDVIKTKDLLVYEQGTHRLELVNLDTIIKENSSTLNIRNVKNVNGKLKLVLPVLFVFLFVLVGFFKSYYRKQMAKLNS
jgi:hypothetical protein